MDVLISGNVSSLAATLVNAFLKEKFRVVVVSSFADQLGIRQPNVSIHSVSPATDHFHEIVSAHKFDFVVYLGTREEHLLDGSRQNTGEILDGLLNVLNLCQEEGTQRLFYISSSEVYGREEQPEEIDEPQPATPNGFTLKTGEDYCAHFSQQYGLAPTIIRVPFIYGANEKNTFLHDIVRKCVDHKPVILPGPDDTICSFLHAVDVAEFILKSLDTPASGCTVVNLSPSDPVYLGQLVQQLLGVFPDVRFDYHPTRRIFTRHAPGRYARHNYDWIAEYRLLDHLEAQVEEVRGETRLHVYLLDRIRSRFPRYQFFLKWTEVLGGAGLMHSLSALSGAVVEFRYVDFRLAYVLLLGGIYGTRVALVAALLASISLLISWSTLDLNWVEMLYNVSNWLPFGLLLSAGVIAGYYHDKKENDIALQDGQVKLIQEKYTYLYQLYQEVSQLKNQFHKQLVGSRDSFGRIFNVTRELDSLEEEEIIFKALHVLEDVMDNHSIAIYSIHQASCYARLEIYSSSLGGQIAKSLNLSSYPELVDCIEKGEVFQNKTMKPGLPAYFVPLRSDNTTIAAVAIWHAGFDQLSLYYANLLNVISGLIESSINRVSLFMNATIDKYYIPGTRILITEYFVKVLKVKNKIKKNKLGDYLLFKVGPEHLGPAFFGWEKLYTLISGVTRAEDYIGVLGDGNCYILFSQAEMTNAGAILTRLGQRGLYCELVTDPNAVPLDIPASLIVPGTSVERVIKRTGPLHINNNYLTDLESVPTQRPETRGTTGSLVERRGTTGALVERRGTTGPLIERRGTTGQLVEHPRTTGSLNSQDRIIPRTSGSRKSTNRQVHRLWRDLLILHQHNQAREKDQAEEGH